MTTHSATRCRARDLGIRIGQPPTGPHNAITDVPGVRVGHATLHRHPDIHTGVTAIVPDALTADHHLSAGLAVGNGYGKLIGATQLVELGEIETPILLTGTLSAFRVADALVSWMLDRPGHAASRSLNPVVGETNDGLLSDIRARPITEADVFAALDGAVAGPVPEGNVGAGAGTTALGYKAGIGTSSRRVAIEGGTFTLGALVQANFGGTLTIRGTSFPAPPVSGSPTGNSCMIVIATDAPLDSRQMTRLARRAIFAMGRVGASYTHGSGDYAIAFTVVDPPAVPDRAIDPLFAAAMDATEEALLNSILMAEPLQGFGGAFRPAVDLDAIRAAFVDER